MTQPHNPPPAPPVSAPAGSDAVTALVLGILGVACCWFVAPVAWYLGQNELRAIHEGRASAAGEGWAMAGKILGMIGTALLVLVLIIGLLWTLFLGGTVALQDWTNR
jgi:mannose/fructose/N-acetylgalactosamine-specific phosphotransferase system component IIC